MIKKAVELKSLEDLDLTPITKKYLSNIELVELVKLARLNILTTIPGVGKIKSLEIVKALDDAGYIFRESLASSGLRCFLKHILGRTDEYYYNLYEYQKQLTKSEINVLNGVLSQLTDLQQSVLNCRFGLKDGKRMSLESCEKVFNISRGKVYGIQREAQREFRIYVFKSCKTQYDCIVRSKQFMQT